MKMHDVKIIRPALAALVAAFAVVVPAKAETAAVDLDRYEIFGETLNPAFALSYFDQEGNSPFGGASKSKIKMEQSEEKMGEKTKITNEMHFFMSIESDPKNYVGWYLSTREGSLDFANKTVLRFRLRGTKNIPTDKFFLGVRTLNVAAAENQAKIYLSDLGYETFPTEYTDIEIPVGMLFEREPNLDLKQCTEVMIFGIVSPDVEVKDAQIWMKDIRWAWDIQKSNKGLLATLSNVTFDTGKDIIKPEAKPYIDRVAEVIKGMSNVRIAISGHTDNTGTDALNIDLSKRRAQSVATYLIKKGVIKADRVTTVGKGSAEPITTNETENGRAQNRRVDVLINSGN